MRAFLMIVLLICGVVSIALLSGLLRVPQNDLFDLGYFTTQGKVSETRADESSEIETKTLELLNLSAQYQLNEDSSVLQRADSDKIVTLAKARHALLTKAIPKTPEILMEFQIPIEVRNKLPSKALSYIESPLTLSGELKVAVTDDFKNKKSSKEYYLFTSGGVKSIYVVGLNEQLTGGTVRVEGLQIGDKIVVDGTQLADQISLRAPYPNPTLGTRKVAVIPLNFQDNPDLKPYTVENMRKVVFEGATSANTQIKEISFGKAQLGGKLNPVGDVFDWVTIPFSTGDDCPAFMWGAEAIKILQSRGYDMSGYDNYMYVLPRIFEPCNFAGAAVVRGNELLINDMTEFVVLHELGHNFGASHASVLRCLDEQGRLKSPWVDCSVIEYADSFDPMGNGVSKHFQGYNKALFNWIEPERYQVISQSGTYTIAPTEESSNKTQVLEIPRDYYNGFLNSSYVIESRKRFGMEKDLYADNPLFKGISVRLNIHNWQTNLIDSTPVTSENDLDAPLLPGRSFQDEEAGIRITDVSTDPTGSQVKVQLSSPTCTHYAPILTVEPYRQFGFRGASRTFKVSLKSLDSSQCVAEVFDVKIGDNTRTGFVINPKKLQFTLSSAEKKTQNVTVTAPADAKFGTSLLNFVATRPVPGNFRSAAWAYFMVSPVETNPPTVNFSSPANGAVVNGNVKVVIHAKDDVGIAKLQFIVDGKVVKTVKAEKSMSYDWDSRSVPNGKHKLTAKASDPSGNKAASPVITININNAP